MKHAKNVLRLPRVAAGQPGHIEIEKPPSSVRAGVGETWLTPVTDQMGCVTNEMVCEECNSERRQADVAALESEERFHVLFQKAPFATILSELPDGVIVEVNEAFASVFGYGQQDVAGRTSIELGLYGPDLREELVDEFRTRGGFRDKEVIVNTKSGEQRIMLANANLVRIGGRPHVLSTLQDITERRRAELRLTESERRLRAIVDNEPECVKLLGAGCTLLDMNPAGLRMIEADSLAQVVGRSVISLIQPEHRSAFAELSDRVLNGEPGNLEFEIQGIKGTRRWLETHAVPLHDGLGEAKVLALTRDITARKLAQAALDESEARTQFVVRSSNIGLWDWDLVTNDLFLSAEWKSQLGYDDDELSTHFAEWESRLHPEDREATLAAVKRYLHGDDPDYEVEFRLRHKDGSWVWILARASMVRDAVGQPIRMMGCHIDITERKRLLAQFQQAQKMEAVGLLAGGVAHDFNNLLTIISGYTGILLDMLPSGDSMRESVTAISDASGRAASLTRQLLAFSRQAVLEPRVLELNAIVDETATMLRRLVGEDVLLTTVLEPTLKRVKFDAGQLEQVLMNLTVNARDAMPKGGKLTIETRNVELDGDHAAIRADCKPGSYVLLTVSDTGCGMAPDVRDRIFEPFFTTKGAGNGTGLGLAMVFGAVKHSGGTIDVYSEPGYGTTFEILFPAVTDQAIAAERRDSRSVEGGAETILLVEDEDGVRGLGVLVLQRKGYKVLSATDGRDALRVIDKNPVSVDLLMTDVVMPGMDGRELADLLRPRFPQMRVLFSSGYTNDAVVRHGVLDDEVSFLQKPYTPLALARKVREVLDKSKSS